MTTKREIITQALGEIGLATYIFDASPEELQSFLTRLNGMAAQWDGVGIRCGYNFGSDIDAESGIPDTAVTCFALNLGCRMAPGFGKVVSPETKAGAREAFNALMTSLRIRPQTPLPSRLPTGTGNRRDVLDRQYFGPNTDEVPGLNDGATEY